MLFMSAFLFTVSLLYQVIRMTSNYLIDIVFLFIFFFTSNQNSVGTSYICFCLFVFISKREEREMIGDEKEHTCSL